MRNGLKPLHAILLAFPVALFVSAVLTDAAFLKTAQMQWSNFSAWLIAGGLVLGGVVIVWAIVELIRARARRGPLIYLLVLAAMWVIGFINELLHSRDAWYSVTATGLLLSIITALLALAAGWIGYRGISPEEVR
jgi:uncharacterized membrane protein